MNQKATLKIISEQLKISISTVSRALSNHPDISDKTKRKVMDLANTLEYEPNSFAISLRTNKSNVFAVLVPEISNIFYNSVISAIELEARKNGYSVLILQSSNDSFLELNNLKLCKQNRVAGIFVCLEHSQQNLNAFLKLTNQDIPVIFFDKVPEFDACNKICVADTQSAQIAAQKIIEHDKKHVLALYGSEQLLITKKRKQAFEEIIIENNVNYSFAFCNSSKEARAVILEKNENPNTIDVVFCMSDEILIGVVKSFQELQISVPQQVGIMAISNGNDIPHMFYPEITYVETSGYKLGIMAFERMQACLAGSSFAQEIIVPSIYVEGQSL
jgi:LacI family transcriptional regulator